MKNRRIRNLVLVAVLATAMVACGSAKQGSLERGMGTQPDLPEPDKSLIPTVQIATAIGWKEGEKPEGASGTAVTLFAAGLDHPRWLHVLPNGDVLVAETNAPERPEAVQNSKGIRGYFVKRLMKKSGAADAQRQPHHAAARCRRRWHGRTAFHLSDRSQFALRHGAGGQ